MCRFIGYIVRNNVVLSDLIEKPQNSLIKQSKHARFGKYGINADGFGIGWYARDISPQPAIFKSIQPAWNNDNLHHLATKLKSKCFVGHVRASTIGTISQTNCHPFTYDKYLFVHNGTIRGFESIKRYIQARLNDRFLNLICGNTDSEHFFALLMNTLFTSNSFSIKKLFSSLVDCIDFINQMLKQHSKRDYITLNSIITNGNHLIASRYISNTNRKPLSLYYATGIDLNFAENKKRILKPSKGASKIVIIASEPLSDYELEWVEVPINHALVVDSRMQTDLVPIRLDK